MEISPELLKRVRQWDEAALAEVYDTYAPALYRYAYRLTGHTQTAQDIVSETFQRFLIALRNGAGPEKHLSAWLYRVAHNLVVDFYRRQPQDEPVVLDGDMPAIGHDSAEVYMLQQESADRIRAALHQLTPLQQQVLVLRFLEEMSNAEVAKIVGRAEGAVKGLLHRAMSALRRVLEETYVA
ncbi:MAG: sigma-70 family RNA polymerase sigma factor [Anaerolineae bacterium]|nr:sigma-70 family RNA polymerase sigma factor [Anaerolineae bacterium]